MGFTLKGGIAAVEPGSGKMLGRPPRNQERGQ